MWRGQSKDGLKIMSLEHLEGLVLLGHLLRGQGRRGRGLGGGDRRGRDHNRGGEAPGQGARGLTDVMLLLNLKCGNK